MEIPQERLEEIRLVLNALPAGFNPHSSPYIPYGKYQSTYGMNLETDDPGLPIGGKHSRSPNSYHFSLLLQMVRVLGST